jgi:hypothetical protein
MVLKENLFAKMPIAHAFALENCVQNVRAIKKLQNRLYFKQKI